MAMSIEERRKRDREHKRKIRAEDPEKHRAALREWRAKNPDKTRANSASNWERVKADPKRLAHHRETKRMKNLPAERVLKKREYDKKFMREYRRKRHEKGLPVHRPYRSRERHLIDYRYYKYVREFLLFGHMGRRKTYGEFQFDSLQLVEHIKSLLTPDMPWAEYGTTWNVDHIEPLASFVYETEQDEDFQRCWALSNLRPMLARHNRMKGKNRADDWKLIE